MMITSSQLRGRRIANLTPSLTRSGNLSGPYCGKSGTVGTDVSFICLLNEMIQLLCLFYLVIITHFSVNPVRTNSVANVFMGECFDFCTYFLIEDVVLCGYLN